ncbi:IS91, transposase, truncation [Escherichia coli]|uniref:IS91, transposase, truncation n=1 Tax=Escherichia coli TaxID=562 RepID=A0AB38GRB2_ECOLX|nr:transposase [Escherichia coli DEC1B]EHU16176.1 transposase [Escherichia coli DEC1A]EHU17028.1 transposase [Escherichia coli DEC1C]EHU18525.1 transposase [Escherichia coli DEC1E]EHU31304.1 transposase [Escherichia coli DEC1D]EHU33420.1 transposase [Escherichia coli DEC2B]EHU33589.1 transposase [Escherichia coli DEC2A]EHU39963.1 transposase [Escherichia coli DEC2C]EHU47887.1 transposase [Escherichia coli DEC2E]STE09439.1 IS91, transposase, truncation [Escherichia coli]
MWRYRITRLLSRKYPELVIPDGLAAEGSSKRDWNRFLDIHYRRGWNVNVSRVMDNATHVAVYSGSYLKKPPVPMSRLEHYASQDEIGLLYNSHRTKREEYLLMSGDEFMERFSWHVADKGGPHGEVLRVPESGETPVAGRSGVRHNRNSEKNGEANHLERDLPAVTEG